MEDNVLAFVGVWGAQILMGKLTLPNETLVRCEKEIGKNQGKGTRGKQKANMKDFRQNDKMNVNHVDLRRSIPEIFFVSTQTTIKHFQSIQLLT